MLTRCLNSRANGGLRRICFSANVINGGHLKVAKLASGCNVANARPLSTSSVLAFQSSGTSEQSAEPSQSDQEKNAIPTKKIIAKEAFIAMLATRMEKPEKEAAEWLGAVQDLIAESLRGNKKVLLTRFGSFDTSGREYRVPPRSQLYPDSLPEEPQESPRSVFRTRTRFSSGTTLVKYLNDPDYPVEGPFRPKRSLKKSNDKTGENGLATKK